MTPRRTPNGHVPPWQPSRREALAYRVAGGVLFLAALFILRLVTWLMFPGPGFQDVTITLDTPSVQRGTLLEYQVNYCLPGGDHQVLVSRELELDDHGTNIPLPGLAYTTVLNCETVDRHVGIPSFTPPGPYRLKVTTDVHTNPLRTVRQVWLSPPFMVIE